MAAQPPSISLQGPVPSVPGLEDEASGGGLSPGTEAELGGRAGLSAL